MNTKIIEIIKKELLANANDKTKSNSSKVFKEKVNLIGIGLPIVNKIAKKHFLTVKNKSKVEILELCEELLQSEYMEQRFVAYDWMYALRELFEEDDFLIFDRWLDKYITNWAECDALCNHSVAAFIEKYPKHISQLKEWTLSKNRWKRRAAAVTLILPARSGKFLDDVFEISDRLLLDEDDLVQKGYGWMLREAAKQHQEEVFEYVIQHKNVMPRTALRYAIEKMPKELKSRAMVK